MDNLQYGVSDYYGEEFKGSEMGEARSEQDEAESIDRDLWGTTNKPEGMSLSWVNGRDFETFPRSNNGSFDTVRWELTDGGAALKAMEMRQD